MNSLALLACVSHASAFVPQSASYSVKIANLIPTVTNTRLSAISTPADDKEKKKKGNESDWTETKGGFIPNLPFRKKPAEEILIQTVDNIHDYKTTVVDEKDKIVVVRFFANWCKSCKASEPYFKKLARMYHSEVKFVQVPLTKETAYLQEGLGKCFEIEEGECLMSRTFLFTCINTHLRSHHISFLRINRSSKRSIWAYLLSHCRPSRRSEGFQAIL